MEPRSLIKGWIITLVMLAMALSTAFTTNGTWETFVSLIWGLYIAFLMAVTFIMLGAGLWTLANQDDLVRLFQTNEEKSLKYTKDFRNFAKIHQPLMLTSVLVSFTLCVGTMVYLEWTTTLIFYTLSTALLHFSIAMARRGLSDAIEESGVVTEYTEEVDPV